jgi:N-acetylglucosamine-6-sulfatase
MHAAPSPKMPRSPSHLIVLLAGIIGGPLLASIPIDQPSFSYSQNFDTPDFAAEVAAAGTGVPRIWSWSNNSTYAGWTRQVVINSVNTTDKDYIGEFTSNTIRFGNMGNGGTFNTLSSPTTDRALGLLMEGIVGAGNAASFGVVFQVGAGLQVTGATVGYVGEQWFRAGATSNDRLDFQYKILTSYNPAMFRIHTETGWTDVDALDFPAIVTGSNSKLNGNAAANRAALSSTVSLTATAGQFIAFRWTNVSDVTTAQAALAVDDLTIDFTATPVAGHDSPNFIVIVTDDQRWDATSFMQSRMASLGRTARFPYLLNPLPATPNLDRLSTEGIHFDNGFCVYSLCSPSRSVMLTGLYPHRNGVTYNDQEFPVGTTTYASLLRDAGWATGYFGKWHHGVQAERPGFDTQRSFRGQGNYYDTTFYDENGTATVSNKWVDEQSTDYLIDFINTRHTAGEPFLAFLGFKTPHGPRQDANGNSNAPAGFDTLFTGSDPVPVPSLLSQGASPPPWKPDANTGGLGNDPRNYMRLISAADAQVGRILQRLTTLGILENTVIIYLSDNGYFIGEHGLGDKRAAYEESLRIPFMIRYPALQAGGTGRIASELALNLDLAPTILDLAGLTIPAEMQGRSLRPLIENQTPADWRDSFFFSYTDDPEFTADPADFIGLRLEDGRKLVRYGLDSSWDELFKTSPTGPGSDPYEISNLVSAPSEATAVAALQTRLEQTTRELGFLRQISVHGGDPMTMEVQAGATYPFVLKTSTDLSNWTTASTFEGSGETMAIDLVSGTPASWDITVDGDAADHVLIGSSPVTASNGTSTLGCGANNGIGRNAVLVFALPPLPAGQELKIAQLEMVARKNFAKWWEADLWALGIKGNTSPILEYHGTPSIPAPPGLRKLQDAIFDVSLPDVATTVRSSLASGLSAYLRSFYQENPGYAGGQYLFLRISPEKLDMSSEGNERYDVFASENTAGQAGPKLHLSFQSQTSQPQRFWRVGYGLE